MPSSSRIIGAEHLKDVRPFNLADFATSREGQAGASPAPEPANPYADDPVWQIGHEDGLREGLRRGLEMARAQAAQERARGQADASQMLASRAAQIIDTLQHQAAQAQQDLADSVISLALELARQTVRKTLREDPGVIVGVVQEALSALLDERGSFVLHLNPTDMTQVGEALGPVIEQRQARLVADPSVLAGGCRLQSNVAEIDATVEGRWRRVLASIGRPLTPDNALDHD